MKLKRDWIHVYFQYCISTNCSIGYCAFISIFMDFMLLMFIDCCLCYMLLPVCSMLYSILFWLFKWVLSFIGIISLFHSFSCYISVIDDGLSVGLWLTVLYLHLPSIFISISSENRLNVIHSAVYYDWVENYTIQI